MALKVEAKGGKGGNQWDDGFDYEGVTKIHVRGGIEGIQFIKFEFVKAGKTILGPIHGTSGRGLTQTFEINHSAKEYLLSVEGYYDESTGVIQSLRFITNTKTSDLMGFNDGTKFVLGASRKKIIGFHGLAEKNLNSLGAYIIKIPSTKSEIQGNKGSGTAYDDGGDYDGIRKVYIRKDVYAIRHLKIDFDKAGQVETRERGTYGANNTQEYEFTVNYPHEYITSVEGTYGHVQAYNCVVLLSLTFKTSKGRTSETVGKLTGTKFVLESKGDAIVGFHGRAGTCVDGIGAYYTPLPTTSALPEKLLGQGSDAGESWDDGAFQNVKKIYVGQGDVGVASVKFEYENDTSEVVVGEEHGQKTLLGYEEFELDYPSEYITSVEGCHDRVMGAESGVITMLRFKTNKRTSPPFGLESTSSFVIEKEGHKIVGFHGKASTLVHQIGVHVLPIA